jgi:hypothetical protein
MLLQLGLPHNSDEYVKKVFSQYDSDHDGTISFGKSEHLSAIVLGPGLDGHLFISGNEKL